MPAMEGKIKEEGYLGLSTKQSSKSDFGFLIV